MANMVVQAFAYVNVYEIKRRYGGPEEGGWYYNTRRCIATAMVPADEAEAKEREFTERYVGHSDAEKRPFHSVLGGYAVEVRIEAASRASEYLERPRYE